MFRVFNLIFSYLKKNLAVKYFKNTAENESLF